MEKDFDRWNNKKKQTEQKTILITAYEREIWWITFGLNIGIEADGKHENYERPAIIIKKFNKHMLWVLPTTSQFKDRRFHEKFTYEDKDYYVAITQIRTVSTKRLLRKAGMMPKEAFEKVIARVVGFLQTNENPQ